jgi:hypothetical protein
MTITVGTTPRPGTGASPRFLTRALALDFVSAFGSMTSFYLLLAVVRLYATAACPRSWAGLGPDMARRGS